ncbi:MAG: hypothetical protein ACLUVG_21125 [Phocaeicola vulgatus]
MVENITDSQDNNGLYNGQFVVWMENYRTAESFGDHYHFQLACDVYMVFSKIMYSGVCRSGCYPVLSRAGHLSGYKGRGTNRLSPIMRNSDNNNPGPDTPYGIYDL